MRIQTHRSLSLSIYIYIYIYVQSENDMCVCICMYVYVGRCFTYRFEGGFHSERIQTPSFYIDIYTYIGALRERCVYVYVGLCFTCAGSRAGFTR